MINVKVYRSIYNNMWIFSLLPPDRELIKKTFPNSKVANTVSIDYDMYTEPNMQTKKYMLMILFGVDLQNYDKINFIIV